MKELSPSAKQFLGALKKGAGPSSADKQRNLEALRATIATLPADPSPLHPSTAPPPPPLVAAPSPAVPWILAGGASVVAVALGLVLLGRPEGPSAAGPRPSQVADKAEAALQKAPSVPGALRPQAAPASDSATREVAAPEAQTASSTRTISPKDTAPLAPGKPRREARLAEEVQMMSKATAALRAGNAADAMKELLAHRQQFPNGALAQERQAAQVQALCLMERRAEARKLLSSLPADSPLAARSRKACGF